MRLKANLEKQIFKVENSKINIILFLTKTPQFHYFTHFYDISRVNVKISNVLNSHISSYSDNQKPVKQEENLKNQ